jgi:hypothetical protein
MIMRDSYSVSGQAGAVGPAAESSDGMFAQFTPTSAKDTSLAALVAQLQLVRSALKTYSSSSPTIDKDDEIGHVARAQIAARDGNAEKASAHLRQVGKWTLEVAKEASAQIMALTLARLIKG